MKDRFLELYKTLRISNTYSANDVKLALPILQSSGIITEIDTINYIDLKFDVVDIKSLESSAQNPLIQKTIEELYKIRSFSSSNGKIVFKSFNKEKKSKTKKRIPKKTCL